MKSALDTDTYGDTLGAGIIARESVALAISGPTKGIRGAKISLIQVQQRRGYGFFFEFTPGYFSGVPQQALTHGTRKVGQMEYQTTPGTWFLVFSVVSFEGQNTLLFKVDGELGESILVRPGSAGEDQTIGSAIISSCYPMRVSLTLVQPVKYYVSSVVLIQLSDSTSCPVSS